MSPSEQLAGVIQAYLEGVPAEQRDHVFCAAARTVDEWLNPDLDKSMHDLVFDPFEATDEQLAQLI
jgi:hypothetical protein